MKRLPAYRLTMHAQRLAKMDTGEDAYQAARDEIRATCRDDDFDRIARIEASIRRRAAGIIDGRIVQSFQGSFKKG